MMRIDDAALANTLRARGDARLVTYSVDRTRARLLELVDALAGGLADPPTLDALRAAMSAR